MTDDQIRTEDCRLAVLYALYGRKTGSHEAATIHTLFLQRHDFSRQEVDEALAFLVDSGWVKTERDKIGATITYQITADGMRFREARRTKT